MIKLILDSLYYCCIGWRPTKQEVQLITKIKDDVQELTKEELEHLRLFLLQPTRSNRKLSCC
jgi:hypothetical protein